MIKYFCDRTIIEDSKWKFLLNEVIEKCDTVEFNILKKNFQAYLNQEILNEISIINKIKEGKLYSVGDYVQMKLNKKVKKFILDKDYEKWNNYCIEDPSFIHDGIEILATITHENYVIMLLSENKRLELNNLGFNFDIEW